MSFKYFLQVCFIFQVCFFSISLITSFSTNVIWVKTNLIFLLLFIFLLLVSLYLSHTQQCSWVSLAHYSRISPQWYSGDHSGCLKLNLDSLHTRQALYLLYYHSCLIVAHTLCYKIHCHLRSLSFLYFILKVLQFLPWVHTIDPFILVYDIKIDVQHQFFACE